MAADDKTNTPSIEEILKDARAELASIKICAETSKTIAAGRIYDKHKLANSPSTELAEAARAVVKVTGAKP